MKRSLLLLTALGVTVGGVGMQAQEGQSETEWQKRREERTQAQWENTQDNLYKKVLKKTREISPRYMVYDLWGVNDPQVTHRDENLILAVAPVREIELSQWGGSAIKRAPQCDDLSEMIWCSLDPELSFLLDKHPFMDSVSVAVCIKQLSGRSPQENYPYIATFWVSPQALFRPTADPDPTHHHSTAIYPEEVDPQHKAWMEAYKIKCANLNPPHAWTQLGYAYDWGNPNDFLPITTNDYTNDYTVRPSKELGTTKFAGKGVSEFIVKPGAQIQVHSLSSIWHWYTSQINPEE